MTTWQLDLLAALRGSWPQCDITPYGSVTEPATLDAWSDLDVVVTVLAERGTELPLPGEVWAFQSTAEGRDQVARVVLRDGRRLDARVRGGTLLLPAPAPDNELRFDAALAAVRLARDSDLIGLHLILGVLRSALELRMVAADTATGTSHHRRGTRFDAEAVDAQDLLQGPLTPRTAMDALALAGRWRRDIDPSHVVDTSGLDSLLSLGSAGGPTG